MNIWMLKPNKHLSCCRYIRMCITPTIVVQKADVLNDIPKKIALSGGMTKLIFTSGLVIIMPSERVRGFVN